MTGDRGLHVVVPEAIDDVRRPSGGNRYDRALCDGFDRAGWHVRVHRVPDSWPRLGRLGVEALARTWERIPDGAIVLLDGLLAQGSRAVLVPAARRTALVVLVHAAPSEVAADRDVLAAARAVIGTSRWLRDEVVRVHALPADRVHVAEPGVDPRPVAPGTASGGELLSVAVVAPHKGHDLLVAALAGIRDLRWRCRCVGALDREPEYVAEVRGAARSAGVADRMVFTGPRSGPDLAAAFATADVLVHPARGEGYGMAVAEALAHGVPVITTRTGGLPDALGTTAAGRPGILVATGDAAALGGALAGWLTDPALRRRLRHAARERRAALTPWSTTVAGISGLLRALP